MAVNLENGESVYCQPPIKERQEFGLYVRARELVKAYSVRKSVLDLGCSDLVASSALAEEGFSVIGLDLARPALERAKCNGKTFLAQADIRNLPLSTNTPIDAVLALDILEHLTRDEARSVLYEVKNKLDNPTFIVSMPIISANLGTVREGVKMIKERKRPAKGLFDRTHQILTGKSGHLELFERAGLSLKEYDFTNCFGGTLSGWENVDTEKFGRRAMVTKKIFHDLPINLLGEYGQKISDAAVAYQGIYVLD